MVCVQCGVCTVWGVYSVGCVQCGVCTVWGVYSVGHVQCGVCTVEPHYLLFDEIDGRLIQSIVQSMSGVAGPYGLDANGWERMCPSFRKDSDNLCSAIANLTRRLCSTYIDPVGISALVACRLVALDKNPGIRPIGIGETLGWLIGKIILCIVRKDVQRTVGSLQLCAGQEVACEA